MELMDEYSKVEGNRHRMNNVCHRMKNVFGVVERSYPPSILELDRDEPQTPSGRGIVYC